MYNFLTNPGSTFNDSKKTDLNKLSIIELKDILVRQDKLLSNGRFINSLPDKGKKIEDYRKKVAEKLKSKELVDETTSILAKLNLSQKVDFKHPMASGSIAVLKQEVDPYAKVLSQALDETLTKATVKFVPNKSKDELKTSEFSSSETSSKNIDMEIEPTNAPTLATTDKQSSDQNMDTKPSSSKFGTFEVDCKNKAEKFLEKYKDTGLAYGPKDIQLQELSVDESLALSKSQIEKEKHINIARMIERSIKYYDNAEEYPTEDEDDKTESDDDKGTSVVFRYMK